jgi:mannose-6-phosphate isomerase-like protein (cupin superfamily)
MKGYIGNIEAETLANGNFRKVIYTGKHSQLVVMSILPGEDIGMEVHDVDQFLRIDEGSGVAILDGVETPVADGFAIVVPAGAQHNVKNTGAVAMKLYTVYSPPEHLKDTVHPTKAAAESDTADHFDGVTTE